MTGGATYRNPDVNEPVTASGFVTTTFAAPADPAGVIAVSDPDETNTTDVAAVPPIVTVDVGTNIDPEIVTASPPTVEPVDGVIDTTVGARYVKLPVKDPDCKSGFVTTTSRAPTEPAGVMAVSEPELTNATDVAAAPPIVTVGVGTNAEPEIVTNVAPADGPEAGVIDTTVGGNAGVILAYVTPDPLL